MVDWLTKVFLNEDGSLVLIKLLENNEENGMETAPGEHALQLMRIHLPRHNDAFDDEGDAGAIVNATLIGIAV